MLKDLYHGKINPSERIPRPEPTEMTQEWMRLSELKVDTERICIANSERTKVASETIEGIFRNWGKVIAVGDATPVSLPGASSATKKIEG